MTDVDRCADAQRRVGVAAWQGLAASADFQRVLGAPARERSAHFALHYVAGRPARPARRASAALVPELSTGGAPRPALPVDDLPPGWWLGTVVPKRHARRAVTRNLLKRQIRESACRHVEGLAGGLWVVRLRAPFDKQRFPSAASAALRLAARQELDRMFGRAAG